MVRTGRYISPEPLHQMMYSFAASRVLFTAVRLGFFSHISSGKYTAQEIAHAAHANTRGARMLLDGLVVCNLLIKKLGRQRTEYRLTPLSAKYLVRDSPDYIGSMMEQDAMWESWQHLPDSVLTGKPAHRVDDPARGAQFFPNLVRSLHAISEGPARIAATALCSGSRKTGLRVLDVACGSGVWGIAIAEADLHAHITGQDFPAILQETRKYVARHQVEGRYDYLAGDLKRVGFGTQQYDLIILGNIVHIEGELSSQRLFRKSHRALRPGGALAIAEMIPNDRRTGPPFPIFFALNMLLNTAEGDTYTLREYRAWLKKAGFTRMKTIDIDSHSPLIIASKD